MRVRVWAAARRQGGLMCVYVCVCVDLCGVSLYVNLWAVCVYASVFVSVWARLSVVVM